MIDLADAKTVAQMLAAVGEPTRMLILHRLIDGPKNVGELSEALKIPMVNMSHHLGVMRAAGLVENKKDGRRVYYSFHEDVYSPGDGVATVACLKLGTYLLHVNKPAGEDGATNKKTKRK